MEAVAIFTHFFKNLELLEVEGPRARPRWNALGIARPGGPIMASVRARKAPIAAL